MDVFLKALQTIALNESQGNCSIDKLITACEKYKIKKGLVDDIDYELKVSKSCIDSINGIAPDLEINKAIVPGQTKVIDGVMYIYSKTKPGSANPYDWHVVRKGTKTSQNIGRGGKLSDAAVKAKQVYINDLFPNDLSALKTIQRLGGSTGAVLMEDAKGNQYVMKKGTNTSADHVKSEYLANQCYNILGIHTPDYELYEDKGEVYLLSRFIQGTRTPRSGDFSEMAKGFAADVLFANWDVYQNDNCLIKNATNRVYRVDNGSCFDWRAQGKQKVFDGDVLKTWNDMLRYNPGIANQLSDTDMLQQIDAITQKKDELVAYLKESGKDELAKIISERIDNFKKVGDKIRYEANKHQMIINAKLGKIPPRKLKKKDEMYAELDADLVEDLVDKVALDTGINRDDNYILTATSGGSWALLSAVAKERGFDARPKVVTEQEFWKLAKGRKHPLMFRGTYTKNGISGEEYANRFRYDDDCFYGSHAVWGQGIYAHCDDVSVYGQKQQDNNHTEKDWKSSKVYLGGSESALSYADGPTSVCKMIYEPDAKIIDADDLLDMIKAEAAPLSKRAKELKDQMAVVKKAWHDAELKLQNVEDIVKVQVHQKRGFDEKAANEMLLEFESIDWMNRNAQGYLDFPNFDDFVVKKVKPWCEKCGAQVQVIDAGTKSARIKIKFGKQEYAVTKYAWDNGAAVKVKNPFTKAYHYHAEDFLTFFDTACIKPIETEILIEVNSGETARNIKAEVDHHKNHYYKLESDYQNEVNNSNGTTAAPGTDLITRIANKVKNLNYRSSGNSDKSVIGLYAMLKGYDGIYQKDGNSSGHGFAIILNRSKIITSVE